MDHLTKRMAQSWIGRAIVALLCVMWEKKTRLQQFKTKIMDSGIRPPRRREGTSDANSTHCLKRAQDTCRSGSRSWSITAIQIYVG